jgi:hypothetical protein
MKALFWQATWLRSLGKLNMHPCKTIELGAQHMHPPSDISLFHFDQANSSLLPPPDGGPVVNK